MHRYCSHAFSADYLDPARNVPVCRVPGSLHSLQIFFRNGSFIELDQYE
jgi:hypothetical protein